jgi:hypothetical protein
VEFEAAMQRMVQLAKENQGTITAAQVESDPELAADPSTVSAAALKLAGATNVFTDDDPSRRDWFPYAQIVFSELSR